MELSIFESICLFERCTSRRRESCCTCCRTRTRGRRDCPRAPSASCPSRSPTRSRSATCSSPPVRRASPLSHTLPTPTLCTTVHSEYALRVQLHLLQPLRLHAHSAHSTLTQSLTAVGKAVPRELRTKHSSAHSVHFKRASNPTAQRLVHYQSLFNC